MKKFKEILKILQDYGVLWSWIIALVSVALIIASFIIPPTGVIDSTVFAAIGELGALKVVLFDLGKMIDAGYAIKYKDISAEKPIEDTEN